MKGNTVFWTTFYQSVWFIWVIECGMLFSRPDTSRRQWRRLPPCPLPWCCENVPIEIYNFSHRVPFTIYIFSSYTQKYHWSAHRFWFLHRTRCRGLNGAMDFLCVRGQLMVPIFQSRHRSRTQKITIIVKVLFNNFASCRWFWRKVCWSLYWVARKCPRRTGLFKFVTLHSTLRRVPFPPLQREI